MNDMMIEFVKNIAFKPLGSVMTLISKDPSDNIRQIPSKNALLCKCDPPSLLRLIHSNHPTVNLTQD
jgi:hypothetical protein